MPQPHIFFGNTGGGGGGSGTLQNVLQNGVLVLANAVEINFTGSVAVSNAGGGRANVNVIAGSTTTILYHAITAPELAAKQFTLPLGAFSFYMADIVDGTVLRDTVDFAVIANQFNWNGLGLDGVIAVGDVVRFVYAP